MILKLRQHNDNVTYVEVDSIQVNRGADHTSWTIIPERLDKKLPNSLFIVGPPEIKGSHMLAYLMENGKTVDTIVYPTQLKK